MPENFWKFRNDGETPELMLYGEISNTSWYGDELTPGILANDLAKLDGRDLDVHINSPGGDVFAALAIYNQLKSYPGKVTMRIDGMCASAATVIACAGDKVIMPSNTIFMIHNPKSAMLGYFDHAQLGKVAERLDAVKQTIVNVYRERVGNALAADEIAAKMDAETWMTADEAKANGFVDEIAGAIPIENKWDGNVLIVNSVSCRLDRFKNAARLRAILEGNNEKRSGFVMTDSEIVKRIKNMFGMGASQQPEAPAEPQPKNEAGGDRADIIAEERQRVAALDAMKNGNPAVDAIIETAKTQGASVESVKPYVDAIPQAEKNTRTEGEEKMLAEIRAMLQDNAESGAAGVLPTPQGGAKNEAAEKAANIEDVANYANEIMGVK